MDLGADAQHGAELCHDVLFDPFHGADIVGEQGLAHFHVDVQGVGVVLAAHDDLIVGGDVAAADLQQDFLDLGREDVDAADDEHVVGAAHGLCHTDVGAAAGALFPVEHADILGAVAQQGEGLFGDGGEDQLALGAVGQDLAGVGVDDLGNEVVLADVHACLLGALVGNTGAGELGEAIDIIGLDAHLGLNVVAHLLGPGLSAEDAGLQLDLVLDAPLQDGFGQVGGVGGGAAQDGGFQVHHELELTVGVAGGHGQGQGAHLVGAAVKAGTAGEQAVAVGDVDHVILGAAHSHDGTGAAILPQVHVVLGVVGHHTLAGGAGGGLDADTFAQGLGHEAVGVALPQVILGDEGELVQILDALDVIGGHTLGFHLLAVVGDIVPNMLDLFDQAFTLEGAQLFLGHGFDFRLVHCHSDHSFSYDVLCDYDVISFFL